MIRELFPLFAPEGADGGATPPLAAGGDGGTPAAGGAPPPPAPERPPWLPERFYDPAAGPKYETLAKSYTEAQSLIGKRIGELDETQRGVLLDIARPEIESLLTVDLKNRLSTDEEWLKPLLEARLPKAPESYELPVLEGKELLPDHPVLKEAQELAKGLGLPQEAYAKLVELGARLIEPLVPRPIEERELEAGPDFHDRAMRVRNVVRTLASRVNGPAGAQATVADGDALLGEIVTPAAFRGLEALLKATQEKPLTGEVAGSGRKVWTKEALRAAVADPRYRSDKAYYADVTRGFEQLNNGETL